MSKTTKKSGFLGCSFPVLIIIGIIVVALLIAGIIGGAIGQAFAKDNPLSKVFGTGVPEISIPAEAPFNLHLGPLPITNTLITSWLTVIFLVLAAWLVTRRMKIIPQGAQKPFEFILNFMYDFCTSIAGDKKGRQYFPIVTTIFLYIMFNAWWALVPGFGDSIHVERILATGEHIAFPLLRAANTDMNLPLALAFVAFFYVEYQGFKNLGLGYLTKFFNFKPLGQAFGKLFKGDIKGGFSGIFFGAVYAFVGILELLSEVFRLVSFTFRLWGNMTAGEIVILIMFFLAPFIIPDIFYGLETLIGMVQGLVFAALTLIFTVVATSGHESAEHA